MKLISKIFSLIVISAILTTTVACGGSNEPKKEGSLTQQTSTISSNDDTISSSSSVAEEQTTSESTQTEPSTVTEDSSTTEISSTEITSTEAKEGDGFDEDITETSDKVTTKDASENTNSSNGETATTIEKPKVVFNENEFDKLENKNLNIVHFVSQDDYKKLAAEGKTDTIWAVSDDFQKKYGGKVRITSVPFGNIITKTISLQNANAAPDLLFASDQTFPSTAATKMLQAMEDLKDNTGKKVDFKKNLWDEATMNAFKFNGKTYAVSGKNNMPEISLIIYNETMFKKEKLTTPKQLYKQGKWNFDEFAKAANKLTKDSDGDKKIDQLGFATWTLMPSLFALANDTALVKIDSKGKYNANFKDAKVLNSLNFLYDAFQSPDKGGSMSIAAGLSFESDFPQGKVAMIYGNPPASNVKFDWDAVPFPVGPDNKDKKLVAQIFGYGIPTGSKNPEGALAFLHMMNDPKYSKPAQDGVVKSLSGFTNGKPDTAKGKWNYDNYRNPFGPARNLKFNVAMDRNFSDVFTVYWNICDELAKGDKAATVAAKYQRIVQSYLDKSYGGSN